MIFTVPVDSVPNQNFTTSLNGEQWDITLETRLDRLYISLGNRSKGRILENRVCLDRTPVAGGFVFIDQSGTTDPVFEGLGGRYVLFWSDELN